MKKIIICSIPMRSNLTIKPSKYISDDLSLPVSDNLVRYPINALLEKTLNSGDDVKALLLVKKDDYSHYEENVADYIKELLKANERIGAKIEYKIIDTAFEESGNGAE